MANLVYVYALHAGDYKVRYIGSSMFPERRAYKHWVERRNPVLLKRNPSFLRWLDDLGEAPHVAILAVVSPPDRYIAEREWTDNMRQQGCDLFNINSATYSTPEHLRAFTQAGVRARKLTGQSLDERTRRSAALRAYYAEHPEAAAAKAMRGSDNPAFGKPKSEETRIRISNSKKGKPWTEARREAQKRKTGEKS